MKTLVSKEMHTVVSRVVEYNNRKFKIVAESHINGDWDVKIYLHTKNGELAVVASIADIPGVKHVKYRASEEVVLKGNLKNVAAAEEYIKLVY